VVSIREGPLELCAIPAMDLLHYAVATVRDSLAQYLTMCIEQSHIDETANSTEFSKKMHTGMEEVTEMFRSIAPALINAICNRYYKMKLELSCDEQFNADDIDLVSISSEHQHYFMTAAQEALPGIATNWNISASPGYVDGWDVSVARILVSELELFCEKNNPIGVATCVRLCVSLTEVMIDADDDDLEECDFDNERRFAPHTSKDSPRKIPSSTQHERRNLIDKVWHDILKLATPFVNNLDVAREVAIFLGELGPYLRYRGGSNSHANPFASNHGTAMFVSAAVLLQPSLTQTDSGTELFNYAYTLIAEVIQQIEKCKHTRAYFGKSTKKIALSSAKSFSEMQWKVEDKLHPLNLLMGVLSLPHLLPPPDLVFAAACFAGYSSEDAVVMFCNEATIPLIQHQVHDCSKNMTKLGIEKYKLDVLINTFGGIRVSGTCAGAAVEALHQELNNALNSTESTPPQMASSQAQLSAMISSACEHLQGEVVANIVGDCASVIKRSMYLCRSSVDESSAVAKSLAIIIDSCGKKHGDSIDASLCSALRAEYDIFEDAIRSCVTIDNADKISLFVEAVLGSFLAGARTGLLLADHILFGQIIGGALKIFGSSIWQCEGERATKMSLDLFKWCLWCCTQQHFPGFEVAQENCMRTTFADTEILKRILIALCSGSLGLTCDVFQSNQSNMFTHDISNAMMFGDQNGLCGDLVIRGQLQRSYVQCLYIILYGDESSIPQALLPIFANASMVAPAVTAALTPYCCKLSRTEAQMAGNVTLATWVVRGLAEKSGRRGQNMRSFFFVVGKVLSGEENLDHGISRTRIKI